jgi:hypothetical protein
MDQIGKCGKDLEGGALEPNVPLTAIGENLDAFKDVIRKLQARIQQGPASGS